MEIANKIHVEHLQNLGIDETKGVREKQPEMSQEYLPETEKPLGYVFSNEGQIVPCQNTYSEVEDNDSRELYQAETNKKAECLTVPQMQIDERPIRSPEKRIEVDDKCLEDGECLQEQGQEEQPNNVFTTKEKGFYVKKFQWPAMGIRNENAESKNAASNDKAELYIQKLECPSLGMQDGNNVITATDKPAVFEQPMLDENEQSPASSTSPVSDPVVTTPMNNPVVPKYVRKHDTQNMVENTTDACLSEQEDDNTGQGYICPSSILKKDSELTRGKQRCVHFPENINIVSVRLYDVSDDEDSDADTVILYSDDEENLTGEDQKVPSNNFSESFSLFANDHDCSSSHPPSLSKVMNVDFKPQFCFPPALKIANYQLFDSPDEEEQMFEDMEISVVETDVAEVVTTMETEIEDSNCGLYDDVSSTTTPSEKVSSVEEPKEIEYCDARAMESHVGIDKDSSAEDTSRNNPDTAKMDMGTYSNSKQGDHPYTVKNESSCENHEYVENSADLEEHEDPENNMSVEMRSTISSRQDVTLSLRQDVTSSSLGRCGSQFLWRGRRPIDNMLIDEAFHVPPLLTKGIQPTNILQTIEEEVPYCHEQIINVVSHETNFLMLSQEKTESVSAPSQCYAGPEKHVIQSLVSSPDHFVHFDLVWGSKPGCDSMHNEREGDVLKDSTEDDPCAENESSKKDPLFDINKSVHNEREGDVLKDTTEDDPCAENESSKKDPLFDINKSKQMIAVEGAGGISSEYEHATNRICEYDEQKELSFSSDFSEEETHVARPTTASTKRGQPILESLPEGCTIPNSNKRLKTDIASSHAQMHSLTISKDLQKRQIQIVPEIEIQESRRCPDVQSTSLHAVPPEVDDIMDYNTPFHLDEQTFQKCCITGDETTYDSEPERLKTINMLTKDDPNNKKDSNNTEQLTGNDDTQSTKYELNAKFKQDVASQIGHACENRRDNKNHFDWETRNAAVNDHSVFKTATGLYSSETHFLAKQSRKHLRVGLSKSTKVKPLHPYWSKNKIK